jgi:cellulase
MECAQLKIVGGSGSAPSDTVSFPGAYPANDPGIVVDIYSMSPSDEYSIPGPDVFSC